MTLYSKPFFAGNDSESVVTGFWNDFTSLPPLIIAGICHMQNVTKLEAESTARQTTVLARIILKQSSTTYHIIA